MCPKLSYSCQWEGSLVPTCFIQWDFVSGCLCRRGKDRLTLVLMSIHNSVQFYPPSHMYMWLDNLTNGTRILGVDGTGCVHSRALIIQKFILKGQSIWFVSEIDLTLFSMLTANVCPSSKIIGYEQVLYFNIKFRIDECLACFNLKAFQLPYSHRLADFVSWLSNSKLFTLKKKKIHVKCMYSVCHLLFVGW